MSSTPSVLPGSSTIKPATITAGPERVLIAIEPDHELLALATVLLTGAGYLVATAVTATEALESVSNCKPDLIIVDLPPSVPNLYRELKSAAKYADIAFLHITRDGSTGENGTLTTEGGIDSVLAHPFTQRELMMTIRATLRERRRELELQQVNKRLQITTRTLHQLVNYSPDAVCSVDAAGKFTGLSASTERIWGYTRDELMGTHCLDLVHPDDFDRAKEEMETIMGGKETHDFEVRHLHKNGRILVLSWTAHWSPGDQMIYCVGRDVTDTRVAELALQRMGQRLQSTLESLTDAFFLLDREWNFAYLNAEAERLMKRLREDVVHQNFWTEFPELTETEIFAEFHRCLADNIPADFEVYVPTFGRWLQVHAFPGDEGLAVYSRDASELRQNNELLRESHERFLNVIRATNHVVWDWDFTNDEMWWADGFENRLGFDTTQIDPKSGFWFDHIHPEDKERVYQGLRQCVESGQRVWSDEYRFKRGDGSFAYVHDRAHIVHDGNGQPIRVVGGMVDVSERREQEQKLRESESRFRQLADNVEDAFWIIDATTHQPLYVNPAYHRMCGSSVDDGLPTADGFPNSIHPSDRERVSLRGFNPRDGFNGEYRVVRPDGSTISVWARMVPVRDAEGKLTRIVGIARDITDRKRLESQVLRSQRLESIGTLAGGIAHDLNNVLAPIVMSIDLLKRTYIDQNSRELLEVISGSAKRGANMVQQVLSFARGVEGERIPIQPRHLIKDIQKIIEETFPKNIEMSTDIKANLWSVVGDPTQLHQVLLNLSVNARDAMPLGGSLTISVSNVMLDEHYAAMNLDAKVGPHVLIDVHDTGTGMPPEVLDKIFDPFFTTKEFGKGTGLGLSTSLAIVKSHGGFLRVYSEVNCGTHFSLYLPASPEAAEAPPPVHRLPPLGHGELVLLVDDEKPIRAVTQRTLEAFGYKVVVATEGTEGLMTYAKMQDEIAVVLTDMMMPIMDGSAMIEVLIRMNPDVKVIAASGMASHRQQPIASHPNVHFFLVKPYTTETLLNALAETLGRKTK